MLTRTQVRADKSLCGTYRVQKHNKFYPFIVKTHLHFTREKTPWLIEFQKKQIALQAAMEFITARRSRAKRVENYTSFWRFPKVNIFHNTLMSFDFYILRGGKELEQKKR
jgi:hypothetical protein